MRQYLMPVALAAACALAGVALLAALSPAAPMSRAAQARAIASDLRCPDCQALSVAESRTASAAAIRAQIDELLGQGLAADEVRQHFVDRYGEWILLAPASPLAWALPVVALGIALVGLAWWLTARRSPQPTGGPADGISLTVDQRRRLEEELERIDG